MSDAQMELDIPYHNPPQVTCSGPIPVEITITVKDESHTFKHKELEYREFKMSQEDPVIAELIASAVNRFHGEPDVVRVSAKFVVI